MEVDGQIGAYLRIAEQHPYQGQQSRPIALDDQPKNEEAGIYHQEHGKCQPQARLHRMCDRLDVRTIGGEQ